MNALARAATFARVLPTHRSLEPIRALPLRRRTLAFGAIAAGGLIYASLGERARPDARAGDAVVSIGGLGDHLRMLSTLTRIEPPRAIDVFTNDNAAGLDGIFEGVTLRAEGGVQGSAFVGSALRKRLLRSGAPYERALVAQPMETQPIAVAFGSAIASAVVVHGDGALAVRRRVPFRTESWRASYENFFSACYPGSVFAERPRVAERFRWTGSRRLVAIHPGGPAHVRGVAASAFVEASRLLGAEGYAVAIVGSHAEGPALRDAFRRTDGEFWLGLDLRELASRLREAAALVAIDSSMMNLADALGVPSVIVYNLTRPETHGPFSCPLVPLVCGGAQTLGTVYDVPWAESASLRGRAPAPADIARAVRSLATCRT